MIQTKTNQLGFAMKALVVAITAATAATATADDHGMPETETLVVIGQATSGLNSLITSEQIEKTQALDMKDLFKGDASISAGGSVGIGQKIYLRGFGEDVLNISVDGAEQAGSVFHHAGRVAIEPELLKQVEIEAGAGSATAGFGALGGSIRLTTKDPEDLLQDGQNAGALLKTTYHSNGEGFKNTASAYGRTEDDRLGGLVSFTGLDLDDREDGNGDDIAGTETDKELAFIKLVAKPSDGHRLSLSHEDLEEKGKMPYKSEWLVSPSNALEPTVGKRKTSIFNYGFDPDNNDLLDLSINLYRTRHDQAREFDGVNFNAYVDTRGLTVKNTSRVDNHKLVYGLNYRDDKGVSDDGGHEDGKLSGVFIQDVIEASEQLTVTGGLRFDKYELIDGNDLKIKDEGLSPNLSANYELRPGLSLSAGYAEAFRGPEIKDAYKIGYYSNSPDLKGETAKNLEVGMDLVGDNYSLAVGAYRSRIKDPIGGEAPWSRSTMNLDDPIKTRGVFFRFDYNWDKLTLGASANLATTTAGGEPVLRYTYSSQATSIGDTLAVHLDYEHSDRLTAGWSAEFVKGMHDQSVTVVDGSDTYNLTFDKPGYAVHDLYARWQPTNDDRLMVQLTVSNLFDKQYLSHASQENLLHNPGWDGIAGSPETGRDVRLTARLKF